MHGYSQAEWIQNWGDHRGGWYFKKPDHIGPREEAVWKKAMDKASDLALDFVWRLMNGKSIREIDISHPAFGREGLSHLYCNCKSEFPNFETLSGPNVPDTISALTDLPPTVELHRTEIFREQKMMYVWMGVCPECDLMYYGRTEPGPVRVKREFEIDRPIDQDVVVLRDRIDGKEMRISGLEWEDLTKRGYSLTDIWEMFAKDPHGTIENLGVRRTYRIGGGYETWQKVQQENLLKAEDELSEKATYHPTAEEMREARKLLTKAYKETREELAKGTLYGGKLDEET